MKTIHSMTKTLIAIAILFACSTAAHAQFGNILNKAKDKVVDNTKHSVKQAANKAVDKATEKAKQKAFKAITKKVLGGKQLPELPWTMAETTFVDLNNSTQPGMTNAYTWLMACGDLSNQEMIDLREKMKARYAANNKILLAEQTTNLSSSLGQAGYEIIHEVEQEQERFWSFFNAISHSINLHATGIKVTSDRNADVQDNNVGLVCSRKGGGFGVMLGLDKNKKGRFIDISRNGTYLEGEELAMAKDCARRMLNYAFLIEGIDGTQDDNSSIQSIINKKIFGESNYTTDWAWETKRASLFAELMIQALNSNSPSNIERKAMPKAGSLNKSLKAQALRASKAEDSGVIDVVITSNNWKVDPLTRRSVTGYVIKQDAHGKRAFSRSWCQDYMGGGKYGSLRSYGVGMGSFYIK